MGEIDSFEEVLKELLSHLKYIDLDSILKKEQHYITMLLSLNDQLRPNYNKQIWHNSFITRI